jgi:hypothetical protein
MVSLDQAECLCSIDGGYVMAINDQNVQSISLLNAIAGEQ